MKGSERQHYLRSVLSKFNVKTRVWTSNDEDDGKKQTPMSAQDLSITLVKLTTTQTTLIIDYLKCVCLR